MRRCPGKTGQPGCHAPERWSSCACSRVSFAMPGRSFAVAAVLVAAATAMSAARRSIATTFIARAWCHGSLENADVVTAEEIAGVELFAGLEPDVLERLAQVVADITLTP